MQKKKPHPKVLDPLFNAFDVEPGQVAIVGDTANDMKTAINANLGLGIGVLTGVAKKRGTLRRRCHHKQCKRC